MSNLGIKRIKIPTNTKIIANKEVLTISSEFGKINHKIDPLFMIKIIEGKYLFFLPKSKNITKNLKILWGTQYSLLKNKIIGISQGYSVTLNLVGVGFKANIIEDHLVLKLGYSHDVKYKIPSTVIIELIKSDQIRIFGLIKKDVYQTVFEIQSLKKVDPYKGKGILLENQKLYLKEGKKK